MVCAADGLEYEQLSLGLKHYITKHGMSVISASSLSVTTAATIREIFDWTDSIPFEEERARLLREVRALLIPTRHHLLCYILQRPEAQIYRTDISWRVHTDRGYLF